MALLLVIATTEAMDPTRARAPFRTTANASETSAKRLRGDTRGVTEEVGATGIVHDVTEVDPARLTMEPRVRISNEGGKQ
jgi:hypothetical protein